MSKVTISQLQYHLDNIIKYLSSYLPFANCHMVNYLSDNLWDSFIPQDIRNEIQNTTNINEAINLFWNHQNLNLSSEQNTKYPHLQQFLKNYQQYSLDSLKCLWLTFDEMNLELLQLGCKLEKNDNLQIKDFMSAKKCSEVEATAHLIANLCTYSKNNKSLFIVDAGDGKGYLSSRLALQYKLKVLGVDASAVNTVGAQKRINKLEVQYQQCKTTIL